MSLDPRITIVTGHFGSGKTEIAINLALQARKKHEKVAITDLDVINPYFRSRDILPILEDNQIELIAPKGKLASADLPIVSGEIYRVLFDHSYRVILDVGGDKDGATALGQYYNDLKQNNYELLFVVNANRPYVSNVAGVKQTIEQIERVSRLQVTGLINNTNLGGTHTTLADMEKGYELTEAASQQLGIPFLYTTISKHLLEETQDFAKHHKVLYLQRYMKLLWE